MSIERDDLRISNCDANCDHSFPVTNDEFAALARQWIAEHPAEAMRELFTEECKRCGGFALLCPRWGEKYPDCNHEPEEMEPCPDCKDGRVLKDGVFATQYVMFPAEWMEADDE